MPDIQWLNTNPAGKSHTHSADDGRTGWRFHAVKATLPMTFRELGYAPSLCGLRPRNGWTLDLFMDEKAKCIRCEAALKKAKEGGG